MATLKNQNPAQHDTHKRRRGGNTPAGPGEQHNQKKAKVITEQKRWDADAQRIEKNDGE